MPELVPSQVKKTPPSNPSDNQKKKTKKKRRNHPQQGRRKTNVNRNKNRKFAWRKHIKNGVVDPISLDPLVKLPYPPFALAISEPYVPIPVWPLPKKQKKEENKAKDELKRQADILEQQWGSKLSKTKNESTSSEETICKSQDHQQNLKQHDHFHLFDGRVLACYLVSQLQFIDPLNRRDLTREEIVNLDQYLKRHKLNQASVLEAFDNRGVTVNSAGISGQTRSGRAQILQEQAQALLNSLFQNAAPTQSGPSGRRSRGRRNNRQMENEERNHFTRQYEDYHANDSSNTLNSRNVTQNPDQTIINQMWDHDEGVYNRGGMLIIDDNANPGLRGVTDASNAANNNLTQNSPDITTWHQDRTNAQTDNFPALSSNVSQAVNGSAETKSNSQSDLPNGKVSKSLAKIGKLVKKTDPRVIERQKKARKEALLKMEVANLPFEEYIRRKEAPSESNEAIKEENVSSTNLGSFVPSEKQLLRNRNLADALGVLPTTSRNIADHLNKGWKRPTATMVDIDTFGKELKEIEYPHELIDEAKERMAELLKIEKKWIDWLNDDTAASCSLKKMDKPFRIFVHKYSDFWNIQTRSYDPEPKRYIHCVKMLETYAPRPLLSDAAKNWQGLRINNKQEEGYSNHKIILTREFPISEDRVPLKLAPPTFHMEQNVNLHSEDDFDDNLNHDIYSKECIQRFTSLLADRERRKIILDPRSKPLELPPFQLAKTESDDQNKERDLAKEVKRSQQEERKKLILEAAFASDDDDSSSASEWDIGEAIYSGSEDE